MTCANCFHSSVCHNYDLSNDVTMCKQFIAPGDVLYGKVLHDHLARVKASYELVKDLDSEVTSLKHENENLEREVELLRIIKQTLEMQSGMKFDI